MRKRARSKNTDSLTDDEAARPKKKSRNKDATRVANLSKQQLDHLSQRIQRNIKYIWTGNGSKDNHDDCCWKSDLPLTKAGYPRSLRLTREQMNKDDTFQIAVSFNWSASHVVLTVQGKHATDKRMEASHLCYHPWCVNPAHLIWEMPINNYARKNCKSWIACPCPCKHEFNPCTHQPQCISAKECECPAHKPK